MTRSAGAAAALALLATAAVAAGCGGRATEMAIAPLEIEAVFDEPLPQAVGPGTPVRISGINVGTVTEVEQTASGAVVRMTMRRGQASIHADATVLMRPRIFLEGHFFMDISPGTPSTPPLKTGARLPPSQTAYKPAF